MQCIQRVQFRSLKGERVWKRDRERLKGRDRYIERERERDRERQRHRDRETERERGERERERVERKGGACDRHIELRVFIHMSHMNTLYLYNAVHTYAPTGYNCLRKENKVSWNQASMCAGESYSPTFGLSGTYQYFKTIAEKLNLVFLVCLDVHVSSQSLVKEREISKQPV